MHQHFRDMVSAITEFRVKRENARAAVANLLGWLGWRRAQAIFQSKWKDITITKPEHGPREGLPIGLGVIHSYLQAQTKSEQTRVADEIISYTTLSGKSLGAWLEYLWSILPA